MSHAMFGSAHIEKMAILFLHTALAQQGELQIIIIFCDTRIEVSVFIFTTLHKFALYDLTNTNGGEHNGGEGLFI